jgi:hypothetical protein
MHQALLTAAATNSQWVFQTSVDVTLLLLVTIAMPLRRNEPSPVQSASPVGLPGEPTRPVRAPEVLGVLVADRPEVSHGGD